jgi:small-conductance mechanosensitive channel
MRQWIIIIGDVLLSALGTLDVGNTASPFYADRVASLLVNKVLCYIYRVELLLLKLCSFVRHVFCDFVILIEIDKFAAWLLSDSNIKLIAGNWSKALLTIVQRNKVPVFHKRSFIFYIYKILVFLEPLSVLSPFWYNRFFCATYTFSGSRLLRFVRG